MKKTIIFLLFFVIALYGGRDFLPWQEFHGGIPQENQDEPIGKPKKAEGDSRRAFYIYREGKTIEERIKVPEGFERVSVSPGSFGAYLRNLALKEHGAPVLYFDGSPKRKENVYEAVIDMDIGTRDLQQCADAVMRLRAEYLYSNKKYQKISFHFTNGFRADYAQWMEGYRIAVEGNKAYWVKKMPPSNTYGDFRKYLDMVFAYAGTLSLSKELQTVAIDEMAIGDVFIQGGSPGHAIIVVDMAENKKTGKKLFLLAQSYMPAQDIQILKNPQNEQLSPWYELNEGEKLYTPEWVFRWEDLKRFP